LIEKSDCKSCHALKEKSAGPSYTAIAERYTKDKATIQKLAKKVITGGSGAWGEIAMSAHPQLSLEQASDMVSYVLSVNDQTETTRAVTAAGIIMPEANNKEQGEYILSVSYQDKDRMNVGTNLVKKNFHFKYPQLKAATSANDSAVAKISESIVRFTASRSWIMFKDIDLTDISSVLYRLDPSQIGGKLTINIDRPDGKELSSIQIEQVKSPQKGVDDKVGTWKQVSAKLLPEKGVHDIYIVYHDPENAQSGMWTTLFLDLIEFRK
jgi:cytochrome c